MPSDNHMHHRCSIRLKGYDYSKAGLYFITICVQDRACLLGKIGNGQMILNDAGRMVESQWLALPQRFANVRMHEFVVMPNHFHGILEIVDPVVGATLVVAPAMVPRHNDIYIDDVVAPNHDMMDRGMVDDIGKGRPQGVAPTTVGDMMDAFKSISTVEYIRGVQRNGWQRFNGKLWQRNYYEHIIRDDQSYQRISAYIHTNPAKWKEDKFQA